MTKASLNGVVTGNEPAPTQGTAGGGAITGYALNSATDVKEHATVEKTPSAEQASRSVAPAAELDLTGWTIPGFLHRWARETPDRGFLQWQGDTPVTYRDVLGRVQRLAGGLRDLGVEEQDRVLIMMDNHLDIITVWFAASYIGGVEVPINCANRHAFLTHSINQCKAKVIFIDEQYLPQLSEVIGSLEHLQHVVIRGAATTRPPLGALQVHELDRVASSDPMSAPAPITYRDVGAIMYTSGTSGPAKGVIVTNAHMFMFAAQLIRRLSIHSDDTFMICLPLFHGNAQFVQLLAVLMTGSKAAVYPRFSGSQWVSQLRESGATVTSLLGVMAQFIFDQAPSQGDRQHACRRIISIPMPSAIAADFDSRFNVRHIQGYGMTEITVPIGSTLGTPAPAGAAGKADDPFYDVRVVDPDTDVPVPVGQAGEIVIRPHLPWAFMQGYDHMLAETVEAWRNFWFHTGDAGRFDEDGYLYFLDRIRDRIRRRGENLSSYEIERTLLEFDSVTEAAAVGYPAAEGDDDVIAFVVGPDPETWDPKVLWEHCRDRMPYFAVPRYFHLVPELPKTSNGKVLKRELRLIGTEGATDLGTIGLSRGTNSAHEQRGSSTQEEVN